MILFKQQFTFFMLSIMSFFLFADQNLMAQNLTQIANEFGFSSLERDTKLGGEISFVFWMLGGFVTLFIGYFTDQVKEYLTKMEQKKHIDKIFLVTFPHKGNFNKIHINVADVIDGIVQDKKNITHINFSKTLLNDKNFNYQNIWTSDNIHLNPENHANLFMKGILDELLRYLQ